MIERERDIVTKVKDKLCWQAPDGSLTYIDHPDDLREAGLVSVTDYLAAKNDVVQANLNMRHLIDRLDDIASKIPGAVRVAGIDSAVSFVYDVLNGRLNGRPRRVAQILIDEIGAAGPESSETTAVRMVEALRSARAEVERLKADLASAQTTIAGLRRTIEHANETGSWPKSSLLPDGVPGEVWIDRGGTTWFGMVGRPLPEGRHPYLHASLVAAKVAEERERCAAIIGPPHDVRIRESKP